MVAPKVQSPPLVAQDEDFSLWAADQARLLRERRFDALDLERLVEEVEAMGRSDRKEIRSRMVVLLSHLLKWQFQPQQRKYGWRKTIMEQRVSIAGVVKDSPSLRRYPAEVCEEAYVSALIDACLETDLHESAFPATCPWTVEQVLAAGFFPGPAEPRVD